jgi:hypothetical protein
MKTTLTIFVSGSKSLKEHRVRLKAMVNNLNGENRLKGCPVTLNMFSYVNLGDNQAEYDDFIENKTDIALFLVEDRMGEKTKEEFLLATKASKKKGTPKIYVFMKEFKERTPEIDAVERLVNEHSDSYYVEYSNLEDLESKVKDRLTEEIDSLMENTGESPKKRIRNLRIWSWLATLAGLFFFLLFLSDFFVNKNKVTLLFIGGGSAVSCLEEEFPEIGNVYDYENSICIAVPTSSSWPIVNTDVMQHHAIKNDRFTHPFFPVCLSAMEADESMFLKMSSKSQFINKGSVLAYHIGDDYLATYVKKTYHNSIIDGKDSIGVKDLAALLRDVSKDGVMIFTTEVGSGTLTYYQKSLNPYNITISKEVLGDKVDKFTDLTPKSIIRRDETPYIMMGSRYYVAKEVYDEGDCRSIKILDENGEAISKSIYLYFAGYNVDGGTSFWIPDEMVAFLTKMDPRFHDIIKNNRLPRENERVIVSLNDYLK